MGPATLGVAEETGIRHVVDPLGGSYYLEHLTASLARAAEELIEEVEALGGMTSAIEAGMPKAQIEAAAARRQARWDRGEDTVVGVNKYRPGGHDAVELLSIDTAAVREAQLRRLAEVRAKRDEGRCQATLEALREGAAGDANLLALTLEAARARATLGEISSAMEREFGRWRAEVRAISGVYGAAFREDDMSRQFSARSRRSPRPKAEGRASWSPSSARMATTAAPRSSRPRSPTSASTSTSALCSRPPRRSRARRSRTMSTSSASAPTPPATRSSCRS